MATVLGVLPYLHHTPIDPPFDDSATPLLHVRAQDYLGAAQLAVANAGGLGAVRVREMLRALQELHAALPEIDRGRADAPIALEPTGHIASSATLLAAAAILQLQSRSWSEQAFHDIAEAEVALLDLASSPGRFGEFVAQLIAAKNLFRCAVGDDKEVVLVPPQGKVLSDDASVALGLAALLTPFAAKPRLVDALALLAIAYQARLGGPPRPAPLFALRDDVHNALAAPQPHPMPGVLVAMEFGRLTMRPPSRWALMASLARSSLPPNAPAPALLWFSMGRYFAAHLPFVIDHLPHPQLRPAPVPIAKPLSTLLGPQRVAAYRIELTPADACQRVFMLPPPVDETDAWFVLDALAAREPATQPITLGWVLHQLELLAHALPASCFEIDLVSAAVPPPLSATLTLHLPRRVPAPSEVLALMAAGRHRAARVLVARAAASVIPNLRLLHGDQSAAMRVVPADTATLHEWSALLKCVGDATGIGALHDFVDLAATPPRDGVAAARPMLCAPARDDAVVFGVDVGGNAIKASLLQLDLEGRHPIALLGSLSLPHRPASGGPIYASAPDFVEYLIAACTAHFGADRWAVLRPRISVVGVGWPGVVKGPSMRQAYVAANSALLEKFAFCGGRRHWTLKAREVHGLQMREAFEDAFGVPVGLINDGVAHGMAAMRSFSHGKAAAGEVVLQIVLGTGLAAKLFRRERGGEPLQLLAELGRWVLRLDVPPSSEFPAGGAHTLLSAGCLGAEATAALIEAGIATADASVPALLVAWLLEEAAGTDPALAERTFRALAEPANIDLTASRCALRDTLAIRQTPFRNEYALALEAARRVAAHLAELIGTLRLLTSVSQVLLSGGTLSGAVGKTIRGELRRELRTRYRLVVSADSHWPPHQLAHLIRLPEPETPHIDLGSSGALGAALAVLQELTPSPPVAALPHDGPRHATFTILPLGRRVRARLFFPGLARMPPDTLGYVRSSARDRLAVANGRGGKSLPYRDYDSDVLSPVSALMPTPYAADAIVTSARNSLNEAFHTVRRKGRWLRRAGDRPVPPYWPVLALHDIGAALQPLSEVPETDVDLVTGLPIAINGRAASRSLLVAHSSDVSWNYEVDPHGRMGSAQAWQVLTELWQDCHDRRLTDEAFLGAMDQAAARLGVSHAQHRLHAGLATDWFGRIHAFAISGALVEIGALLCSRHEIRHAVVFDNGGSVAIHALVSGHEAPQPLVAGANYRSRGTVHVVWQTGEFPHPLRHPSIKEIA